MAEPSGNPPNPLVAYVPHARVIQSISSANPCVITTTEAHGYLPGIFIYVFLPFSTPFAVLNSRVFPATILSSTSFSIPFDTHLLAAYSNTSLQVAQVCPAGELDTLANSANVVLI